MKIFPLKFMSPLDRAKTLINTMSTADCASRKVLTSNVQTTGSDLASKTVPDYDRQIEVMGSRFSVRELREIYRNGLEILSRNKVDTKK